jgi:cyclophilin family peptidyl-prolyl cis-trans isomerase/protein-disulfide isomerase
MSKSLFACIVIAILLSLSGCGSNPTLPGTAALPTATATQPRPAAASPQPTAMPCMLVHAAATPEAFAANFEGRGHIAGPADAPVTIIVFGDYQDSMSVFLESSLRQVRKAHQEDVRLIFITTPQSGLDKDLLAAQAAEAADLQGKYWEMHDLLFEKFSEWTASTPADFEAWLAEQAAGLGLDATKFQEDFRGSIVQKRVTKAAQSAESQSARLPQLFVNSGSPYTGLVDFPSLDTVVALEALEARQFSACPATVTDPGRQYIAHLHTSKGDIAIELFADKSPLAVNNFVYLARQGWYDGITFYRVMPGSMVETGDPSNTGMGNPGYFFTTEIPSGLNFDRPGMVAMSNNGVDTNGSRFFITLAAATNMDGQYTIIGHVLSGLDVLNALTPRDPKPAAVLPAGDELIQVAIEEK